MTLADTLAANLLHLRSETCFLASRRSGRRHTPRSNNWHKYTMEKHSLDHSDSSSSPKRQRREDGSLPDEQVAAQPLSENQTGNEEFLCDDCRAVDWSSLPTSAADGLLDKKNRILRSVNANFDELRTSSCRICAILSIIKPPALDGRRCVLKALPLWNQFTYDSGALFRNNYHVLESVSQWTVLIVEDARKRSLRVDGPQSLAVVKLNDLSSRRITPNSIDYNRLRDLVRICEKGHKRCHRAKSRPNVMGLEVIDTKTQEVVKAPDQCKYLALSYMWGKQAGEGSIHDIQHCPPVIKDAISVTNSMGYNYLWVDRYVSHHGSIYSKIHKLTYYPVYQVGFQREASNDQPNGPDLCQRLSHNHRSF